MTTHGHANAGATSPRPGFTLIELLVVIAVIALLISLLLPALRAVPQEGRRVKELAASHELILAYLQYAEDGRGQILPGIVPHAMIEQGVPAPVRTIVVRDQNNRLLEPTIGRLYPWRLAPYVGPYDFHAMLLDNELYTEYAALQDRPYNGDFLSRQYGFANNPTLGINTSFLGFDKRVYHLDERPSWWKHIPWVSRIDEVRFTDRLMVFASARGPRLDPPIPGSDQYSYRNAPGYFGVQPPRDLDVPLEYDDVSLGWDEDADPWTYGFLDLRYSGKAVTSMFDGHAQMLGLTRGSREGLRDMMHWSNDATADDWSLYPQQSTIGESAMGNGR